MSRRNAQLAGAVGGDDPFLLGRPRRDVLEQRNRSMATASAFAGESGSEDNKVIVRSNGTVTYVGKDIAYQLWKFGLLGKDFY